MSHPTRADIDGGAGDDLLEGTETADVLRGLRGDDRLLGLGGDDLLEGGIGDDRLEGGDGADRLDGGVGVDVMSGGAGDDIYYVNSPLDRVIELGREGNDTVISTTHFDMTGSSIENLTLIGSAHVKAIGNHGRNRILGNDGNNLIDGGYGGDYMAGGKGNDTYYVRDGRDLVIELAGEGKDRIFAGISVQLPDHVEFGIMLEHAGSNSMWGNAEHNILMGNSYGNRLEGGLGDDRLIGGLGDDYLDGGSGVDILIGGAGNDTYDIDAFTDTVIEEADGGIDTLVLGNVAVYRLPEHFENLYLPTFAQSNLIGNAADNILTGGASNNVFVGLGGADTINGGGGFSRIDFHSVSDSTTDAPDTIVQLLAGDIINLQRIDADTTTAGDQAFTRVDELTGVAGQLVMFYAEWTESTEIQADVDGDGNADFRIIVLGAPSDFNGFWL